MTTKEMTAEEKAQWERDRQHIPDAVRNVRAGRKAKSRKAVKKVKRPRKAVKPTRGKQRRKINPGEARAIAQQAAGGSTGQLRAIRGTRVRMVRGGLPTLGKRRR